jgi:hypothetical protein
LFSPDSYGVVAPRDAAAALPARYGAADQIVEREMIALHI